MDVNLGMRYLLALARDWPAGCDRRKGGGVVSEAGRLRVLEVWKTLFSTLIAVASADACPHPRLLDGRTFCLCLFLYGVLAE